MKILLLTHNPISTNSNMGKTFQALFSEFPGAELCQLYIYPTIPDVEKCNSYYRITDKDVLWSYFGRPANGKQIEPDTNQSNILEDSRDRRIFGKPQNQQPLRALLRDLMWRCSRWYSRGLQDWLTRECPTHIFVAPGPSKFLYDMALRIAREWNLPMVTYICDDFYFLQPGKSLLEKWKNHSLRGRIEKLLDRSSHLVVISEEIKGAYKQRFSLPVDVIMTGSTWEKKPETPGEQISSVSYFGNINCGRYRSLAEIGRQIDDINAENGTDYHLNLYTGQKDERMLSAFTDIRCVKLCGFVSGDAFIEAFSGAEALLHVEDFSADSIDLVKHSISTKIADCLACGKPLFAYGPDCIASMAHLMRNDCAIIATSGRGLRNKLEVLFRDSGERSRVVVNAVETAEKYHNLDRNSRKLRNIFEGV